MTEKRKRKYQGQVQGKWAWVQNNREFEIIELELKGLNYVWCYCSTAFPSCCYPCVLAHNLSYGNEFFLHVHCLTNQTQFHKKGCAPQLLSKKK